MNNFNDACTLSCDDWLNNFSESYECDFSKTFEKEMQRLVDKMRNDKYHKFTRKTMSALIIAAVVLSFATTAFAIPSSRKYIIEKFTDHFSYAVIEPDNIDIVEDIIVGYIPEGYEKRNEYIFEKEISQEYQRDDEWFIISKNTIDTEINFDALDTESKTIDGTKYLFFVTDSTNGVIWNDSLYVYSVSGKINKEELIKIAIEIK